MKRTQSDQDSAQHSKPFNFVSQFDLRRAKAFAVECGGVDRAAIVLAELKQMQLDSRAEL